MQNEEVVGTDTIPYRRSVSPSQNQRRDLGITTENAILPPGSPLPRAATTDPSVLPPDLPSSVALMHALFPSSQECLKRLTLTVDCYWRYLQALPELFEAKTALLRNLARIRARDWVTHDNWRTTWWCDSNFGKAALNLADSTLRGTERDTFQRAMQAVLKD